MAAFQESPVNELDDMLAALICLLQRHDGSCSCLSLRSGMVPGYGDFNADDGLNGDEPTAFPPHAHTCCLVLRDQKFRRTGYYGYIKLW